MAGVLGRCAVVVSAAPDRGHAFLPGLVRVERVEIVAGEVVEQVRNPGAVGELTGVKRVEHVPRHQRVTAQEDRARVTGPVPPVDALLHAIHHRVLSRHQILL